MLYCILMSSYLLLSRRMTSAVILTSLLRHDLLTCLAVLQAGE